MGKNILFQYIEWHFIDQPKAILKAWKSFLLFNLNYFSVHLLLKTFFSPWRRLTVSYGRGFDVWRYLEAFIGNMTARIIGAIMKSFLIVAGILTEILILFFGLVIFLAWMVLPLLLVGVLWLGFKLII